ncbi:hypothetical protein RLEG12_00675 (plasmid) [Rhizobium leguminosarum bv. trifolii CB782]|nr:hypothetical protein RLEG12_00675 [Rhizobium leguminosarum bv. trifolii CB782]
MSRALSDDLRSHVLATSADGLSAGSAAARFGIGISTAIAWIANARKGQMTEGKQGRRSGSRLDEHETFIIGLIDCEKNITLNEMVMRLSEERSMSIGHYDENQQPKPHVADLITADNFGAQTPDMGPASPHSGLASRSVHPRR